ncbi:MFS transporter [Kribbella sp. NPDC056861]|uniref:MFS transporter n=1 Tax=Kribbella sp. NPDC056861 TaxID=3154857 RepID=UPI00343EBFB9
MTQVQDKPRTGTSADVLGALSLAGLGFAIAGLGACVALLARDLDESTDRLAVLPSAFAVGLLVVAAAGSFVLRTDAKLPVLRAGALVCAIGTVLLAVAHNLVVALVGGLLVGLGGALMILVVPLMLSGPRAAIRIARANAISSTTGIFAPLVIGTLDSIGPTGRLAMLLAAIPLVLLVPLTRSYRAPTTDERAVNIVVAGGAGDLSLMTGGTARRPWGSVFGGWSRVVLAVAVEFCFVIWAVARMLATDLPAGKAALLASAFPIGMAIGRVIGPVKVERVSALLPGAVLAAAGTVLVTAFDTPVPVTIGLGVAGLGVATMYPIVLADLISIPGVSPAHLSSLSACASGVAILLAPAALAALAGVLELRAAFLIPLPLLVILLLIRRPARPQPVTVSP